MKKFLCFSLVLLILFLPGNSSGHFTGIGHVHTVSKTEQIFLNPDCRLTRTCDLRRFTLTTLVYEVWFSDDPTNPTYGNSVIMEYETESVDALVKYAIVQFVKGCVFYSSKTGEGRIKKSVADTIKSFGENIPYCFPQWVIDSQDTDPVYNSDPEYGRFYLLRWNKPGSHDKRSQKYYGAEKPKIPVVYLADHPAGAFITGSGVKNVALEFKTCIFKASDVPAETRREHIHFAKPITCLDWQNIYVYDFNSERFQTTLAEAPRREEPPVRLAQYPLALRVRVSIALAVVTFLARQVSRPW